MSISFWHVSETAFPVKKFVQKDELNNGQMIIGVNWSNDVVLSSILKVKDLNQSLVKNSDDFFDEIVLADVLKENFNDGFFFDVNGDLVAMRNLEGKIIPIYSYLSCINCLLGGDDIIRPSLGINYISLSSLVPSMDNVLALNGALIAKDSRGVAVQKGSLADVAGLEEGDIITSVNNIDIDENNNLSDIISKYNIGDELLFIFERDGEENSTTITLSKK
jgi:membrane-associated protease RseP (regulator of RpoE activity)